MKTRIIHGDIEAARRAAVYIGSHVSAWENGMSITVEEFVPPRTQKQNGLYHVLLQKLADESGAHPSDLKDFFSEEYAPRKIVNLKDRQVSVPLSSTEWSKEEMSAMIERVKATAAECNFRID